MNSGKGHQEEDDGEGEEFGAKDAATSASNNAKNAKKSDKSNATTRSKHSVTEQRRRSKINESVEYANKLDEEKFTLLDAHISDNNLLIRCSWRRGNAFQILRELIPNSDQKRDTASFLCEVIQYVQFLQEKVTKYEGSYQPWSSEPTKLMPWRNNQWRNLSGQPQTPKNSPGTAFPIRFDERSPVVPASLQPSPHNPIEPDHAKDASCRPIDLQTELPNKNMNIQDGSFSHALHGPPSLDAQSTKCPNSLNIQDDLAIEGGAINISSVYSQGLLNSLAQALESTGVDLSQANIAVQINIGNRAHTKSIAKDHGIFPMPSGDQPVGTFKDTGNDEDLGQSQKRPRSLNTDQMIKQGIIAQSIPEINHFLRIE